MISIFRIDTVSAIILTQIPIAAAILIAAYEVHKAKKELLRILERLSDEGHGAKSPKKSK